MCSANTEFEVDPAFEQYLVTGLPMGTALL